MAEFKNTLSWSISRDRLFTDCQKAYYFQYYASWGGWKEDGDEFAKKAYLLKNVRSIDIWIGDIIHQVIAWVMRSKKEGKDVPFKQASEHTLKMLKRTWTQSSNQWWKKNIKANLNLFEHYYDQRPEPEVLRQKMEKAARCIRNFYECGLYDSIDPDQIISVDEFDVFELEGVKVFAIPDLVVSSDKYTLYDWKTGRPSEKDQMQLSMYVLYAISKWGITKDDAVIMPVYLSNESVALDSIECIDSDVVMSCMAESYGKMKAVLSDVDNNIVDPDKCPRTTETWRCNYCKFKEICLK